MRVIRPLKLNLAIWIAKIRNASGNIDETRGPGKNEKKGENLQENLKVNLKQTDYEWSNELQLGWIKIRGINEQSLVSRYQFWPIILVYRAVIVKYSPP